ncbi:hypothetical protein [Methylobacterium sp. A54F]
MPWLALLFTALSALSLAQAGLTGSVRALAVGVFDAALAVGAVAWGVAP